MSEGGDPGPSSIPAAARRPLRGTIVILVGVLFLPHLVLGEPDVTSAPQTFASVAAEPHDGDGPDPNATPTRTIPGPAQHPDVTADGAVTWSVHAVADDDAARDLEGVMEIDGTDRHLALGARAHLDIAWLETVLVLAGAKDDAEPLFNTGIRIEAVRFEPPLVHSNGSHLAQIVLPSLDWQPLADGTLSTTAAVNGSSAAHGDGPWGRATWRAAVAEHQRAADRSTPPWRPLAVGATLALHLPNVTVDAGAGGATNVTFQLLLDHGGSAYPTAFVGVAEPHGTGGATAADAAGHNAGVVLERSGRHAWSIVQPGRGIDGARLDATVHLDPASGGGRLPVHDVRANGSDDPSSPRARLAPLHLQVTAPLAADADDAGGVTFAWHLELGHGFTRAAWDRDVMTRDAGANDASERDDDGDAWPVPGPSPARALALLVAGVLWLAVRRSR